MKDLILNVDTSKQAMRMAENLSKSKIIPYSLVGKPQDIFAIMLMGMERNIPTMTALQEINVIQGKPCVSVYLLTGLVYRDLPTAIIKPTMDWENETVTCFCARSADSAENGYTSKWDRARVESLGLVGKDNYKKQFMNMLRCRATSEACRVVFPDSILGLYVPEEFQDLDGRPMRTVTDERREFDEEHAVPPEEKEIGSPLYRILTRKHAGAQLQDLTREQIEDRIEYFDKQEKVGKLDAQNREVHDSMVNYLTELETAPIEQMDETGNEIGWDSK